MDSGPREGCNALNSEHQNSAVPFLCTCSGGPLSSLSEMQCGDHLISSKDHHSAPNPTGTKYAPGTTTAGAGTLLKTFRTALQRAPKPLPVNPLKPYLSESRSTGGASKSCPAAKASKPCASPVSAVPSFTSACQTASATYTSSRRAGGTICAPHNVASGCWVSCLAFHAERTGFTLPTNLRTFSLQILKALDY